MVFRKKIYESLEQLQTDLDGWIDGYNQNRTQAGKYCYGRTPLQTWLEFLPLAKEKMLVNCLPQPKHANPLPGIPTNCQSLLCRSQLTLRHSPLF